jgi:hypothetical protein
LWKFAQKGFNTRTFLPQRATKDAEKNPGLPLIHTDDTDKKGLPRINADEYGLGKLRGGGKGGDDANVRRELWPFAWDKPTPIWDGLG